MDWPHPQARTGAKIWFRDLQSPWQKGAIEHANRRLRRWMPRDTDPAGFSQADLRQICAAPNETPRKCLGFRTPAEVFRAHVLGRGHRNAKLSTKIQSHLG